MKADVHLSGQGNTALRKIRIFDELTAGYCQLDLTVTTIISKLINLIERKPSNELF